MDSRYFEPVAGCVAGGAVGYATSSSENAMKNAAIFCVIVGGVATFINYHYDTKYGKEFHAREAHLDNTLRRYEMLEKQNIEKKEDHLFRRQQEILPPRVLPNGQGIGPRIKEKLILNDDGIDLGT